MRVLICYATTEGQTRKIAEHIAEVVAQGGGAPTVVDAATTGNLDPQSYDAVLLAGSVHMGRYQVALSRLIKRWRHELNGMAAAFISVSLSAASNDPQVRSEIDECAQAMLLEAGWRPRAVYHAAGAFRFAEYGFFRRWMARLLAAQMGKAGDPLEDAEYTDWDALDRFVEDFIAGAKVGAGLGQIRRPRRQDERSRSSGGLPADKRDCGRGEKRPRNGCLRVGLARGGGAQTDMVVDAVCG